LKKAGYRIHHLPFSRDPVFLFRLLRFFRGREFDVVNIQCERASFWYGLVARLTGCRCIVRTVQNCFNFQGALRLRRKLQRWAARVLFSVKFVAVSESVRAVEWGRFRNPSRVIPNWAHVGVFQPPSREERERARARFGAGPDVFVVASVGNCSAVKNHGAILKALAGLNPPRGMLYLHAGFSPEERGERRLAGELQLDDTVRFLGRQDDVRSVLHAADCYVMPSLYEGLGIAALEALACGVPCVLSDTEGLRDLREHGEGILWIDPSSAADGIVKALARLLGMAPGERQSQGREGAQKVREAFGPEKGCDSYLEVFGLK
jgi:glycosyltransferase involved in cell wall biosynthesis